MATNSPESYGRDIACIADADELFTEAVGLDVVMQDVIHVITSDDFLGPGGDGRGKDVRKFSGLKQNELTAQQPIVAEVIERDDRIDRAEVTLTEVKRPGGLFDVEISVACETALGQLSFTKLVSELTTTFALEGEQVTGAS